MQATSVQQRILVFCRAGCDAARVQGIFEHAAVEEAHTFDEALNALRQGHFDYIISEQRDFLALERAAVDQQAAVILQTIGQGVGIFDLAGQLVWANPKLRGSPEDLIRQISEACVRTFGSPSEQDKGKPAHHRARRFSLACGNDQHFEVTITPVMNSAEEVTQVAVVAWDVTHSRRLQKKIDAIDMAGRELVRIDAEQTAGMNVQERVKLLEQKMLRYMHDLLHFDNFAVLLIDKKTNRLEFVLQHGMTPRSQDYDMFAAAESNGISGYVAATGRSYICHDTSKDPRYLQGMETARSSLTVPLRLHDKIIGVLNIESDQPAAFNEDDRQFAEILARYVAIALNILDLLILERYESTGQLCDDVIGEISGPLNDIITDARTLMDEYIGNDEMRRRLNTIVDNVSEIKRKVRDVAKPKGGILGRWNETTEKDPLLEGKSILVADDEEIIRETIGQVLEKQGCVVETASDGRQAIEMIQNKHYDMVLADIRMPHKNGYEVFAAAKDHDPVTCVMLMTGFGYDPNHSIVRARQEGLSAVLFKPFKVDQLLSQLKLALEGKVA
ncbi:MAG TPA: response regulator [Phycisphaerae bacterium]|nr:response regulator [Phycisphaerae bacterium]